MKLYDLKLQNGKFVDTLTRGEIVKKFGITEWRFETVLDKGYLLGGKYWIDDSEEDTKVTRNGCKELLRQFDEITRRIRRAVGWES